MSLPSPSNALRVSLAVLLAVVDTLPNCSSPALTASRSPSGSVFMAFEISPIPATYLGNVDVDCVPSSLASFCAAAMFDAICWPNVRPASSASLCSMVDSAMARLAA